MTVDAWRLATWCGIMMCIDSDCMAVNAFWWLLIFYITIDMAISVNDISIWNSRSGIMLANTKLNMKHLWDDVRNWEFSGIRICNAFNRIRKWRKLLNVNLNISLYEIVSRYSFIQFYDLFHDDEIQRNETRLIFHILMIYLNCDKLFMIQHRQQMQTLFAKHTISFNNYLFVVYIHCVALPNVV